jgi:signal transduction histidine kinase
VALLNFKFTRNLILMHLFVALGVFSSIVNASAESQPAAKAYWYDNSSHSTLADAKQATFTTYRGILTLGYLPGDTWVKIRVKGQADAQPSEKWVLWIRPTYLDEVSLFDPDGQQLNRVTGDRVLSPEYLVRPTSLGFRIPIEKYDRDIYLKLNSSSTHLIDIQLMTEDEFLRAESFQAFWQGIFFGVMGLILLWALVSWIDKRDALLGLFFFKHLVVTFYAVGYLGYLPFVFSAGLGVLNPDTIFSFTVFAVMAVGLRFQIGVLTEYGLYGWRLNIFKSIYIIPILAVVLAALDRTQEALNLVALITAITSILLFLIVLITPVRSLSKSTRMKSALRGLSPDSALSSDMIQTLHNFSSPLSKPILLAYYGAIVVALVAAATQTLGLLQGDVVVLYAYLLHSFISSVLILFLLLFRGRNLQRQQNEIASHMARAQGELAAQRLAQEDQGRMVEMLGHEIKTPLSVLQFAIDEWVHDTKERNKFNESIDQIKTVTERSIKAIEQSRTEVTVETLDLVSLVRQQFNKTKDPSKFSVIFPDVAEIYGNRLLIEQILGNLFDNALKYGLNSTPIEVSIRFCEQIRFGKSFEGFELTVVNQVEASGFPDPEKLFKKYYRAESSKSKPGSGLGLYLVQSFVRFLNGEIACNLRNNRVEFVLWLPVKKF